MKLNSEKFLWLVFFILLVIVMSGCASKPKIQYVTKTKLVYVTIDDRLFDCKAPPIKDPDFWKMESEYNSEYVGPLYSNNLECYRLAKEAKALNNTYKKLNESSTTESEE